MTMTNWQRKLTLIEMSFAQVEKQLDMDIECRAIGIMSVLDDALHEYVVDSEGDAIRVTWMKCYYPYLFKYPNTALLEEWL